MANTFTQYCSRRAVFIIAALAASSLVSLSSTTADAQILQRFALRGELGIGTMLAADQRQAQGYGLALQGSLRVGFTVIDPLVVEVGLSSWYFPSSMGDGQALLPGAGLRVEPRIANIGRLQFDAHALVGLTGFALPSVLTRFSFDVGVGFEFTVRKWLGIGPVVRYGHIVAAPPRDVDSDGKFWSGGVLVSLRMPPPEPVVVPIDPVVVEPPPPADTDHDGVMDPDDLCVTTPAGEHPDPARRGCPLGDADGDTVLDPDDQCVNQAQGPTPDPARRGCPDGDNDSDGVRNQLDQCRDVGQGPNPDPARVGCPRSDRDGDSVWDDQDHCPDQPGAPNPDPSRNGCPGLVRVANGLIQISTPVFFATNRDVILPRSFAILTAVADVLRASEGIRRVSVEGHTDDVGNATRNMGLSERRAASVVRWLVDHGIQMSRLESHGFGSTRPLITVTGLRGRAQRDARAQNRRVDFRIVGGQ
jgi:outer membrane protein OmpA-like peptidoglycan-associated protein